MYKEKLEAQRKDAEEELAKLSEKAQKDCEDPSSSTCMESMKALNNASAKLAKVIEEQEKGSKSSYQNTIEEQKVEQERKSQELKEEQERKSQERELENIQKQEEERLKNEERQAKNEYTKAVNDANKLYSEIAKEEKEIEDLTKQIEQKEKTAKEACDKDPNSAVCTNATNDASMAKEVLTKKQNDLEKTKSSYDTAKERVQTAYEDSVKATQSQAQNDIANSQKAMDESKAKMDELNNKMSGAEEEALKRLFLAAATADFTIHSSATLPITAAAVT